MCKGKIEDWAAAGAAGVDGWSAAGERTWRSWRASEDERVKRHAQHQNQDAHAARKAKKESAEEGIDAQFVTGSLLVMLILLGVVFVMLILWVAYHQKGKGKRQE